MAALNTRLAAWVCTVAATALAATLAAHISAQAPATPAPYTVVSRDNRRPLPVRSLGGQEMFALDELARLFDLTVRDEAAAGGLSISGRAQSIALSAGQPFASVAGRLISLPAPAVRDGRAWLVPVDFIPRVLAPAGGSRIELRRASRLIVLGDVRLPQVGGRIEMVGGLARLTLDLAPATPHTVTAETNRLVIRFEADALDATLPASPAPDLIQAVRPGATPPSLVVELGPSFASFRTSDQPGERGTGRLVIDVVALTAEPIAPPALPPLAAAERSPRLDPAPAGWLKTVAIDAGHGGSEAGARGAAGTLEKTVTLSVARKLKAGLEATLGVRVIMTRDDDQSVGLDERAAVANNNKADLFISLHANASFRPAMSGAEVFSLGLAEYGEEAQRMAQADGETVPVFGGGTRDIEVTLWEMAQVRHIARSAALAQVTEAALRGQVAMSPRAIQEAPLRVLVGANMPAILVEMAFLTNPQQEREIASEAFQNTVAQALVTAITRYRDGVVPIAAPGGAPSGRARR